MGGGGGGGGGGGAEGSGVYVILRTDAPNVLAGARLVRPKHTSEF